ncbi:MAG: DNA polymerase III subunit gamma/tau [Acidimicrobiales bacterium]
MADAVGTEQQYQSLYRRFRPQRFADVRGQDHVTRALGNAVREGRVAHAYLFSGPRGTGKTSTARILAMALNCDDPVDGEPDGTCASCVSIRQGSSLDVQELDAASNRGIDEMRDLLSRVALGIPGRWKVYIVDEVHQLTPVAASALLKTLEEPPSHVVFVLATTDPQKVLQTIRSRTQHYEFHLLGSDLLAGLLRDVNDAAALDVAPEAIDLVVRRGHGSARDALSVLDQVAALGGVDDEAEAVGVLVDALAEQDPGRVLLAVAEAVHAGRDPRRLATDLIEHLRNGFLAEQAPSLVMLADDAAAEAERQARQLGRAGLVRALEVLGRTAVELRDSVDPRVTLEVALVRLASPAADTSVQGLLRRVERLEAQLEQLGGAPTGAVPTVTSLRPPAAVPPDRAPMGDPPPLPPRRQGTPAGDEPAGQPPLGSLRRRARGVPPAEEEPAAPPPRPPATPPPAAAPPPAGAGAGPPRDEITKLWGDRVLPDLPGRIKAYWSAGRFVAAVAGRATFALPDRGLLGRAQEMRAEVEQALTGAVGQPVALDLIAEDQAPTVATGAPPPSPEEDAAVYDVEELEDAGPAVVSPHQRLLEAFPGAEEVTP